jgi:Fe-S cluster biogenesis protein NfuA
VRGREELTVELTGKVTEACRAILAPLVHADGGELYLVSVTPDDVHIHLAGTCSGCPGASFTRDKILLPIVGAAAPKARLTVTTGSRVPAGATKLAS